MNAKNPKNAPETNTNAVIEIEAVSEEDLETVDGGRYYGWSGGGWDTSGYVPSGWNDFWSYY